MARRTRHGPAAWVVAGLRLLAERGEAAVGIEPLARRLGASKGSFYHHFADREALLATMLEAWRARAATALIERVESVGGSPASRLWALMETVIREGAASPEPAIRLWAHHDAPAQAALVAVDRARLEYLETLFDAMRPHGTAAAGEAPTRARIAYLALIGEHALGERPSIDERLARARKVHALLTKG